MTPSTEPSVANTLPYWLALHHAPSVGGAAMRRLLTQSPNPTEIFRDPTKTCATATLDTRTLAYLKNPAWDKVESDLSWADGDNRHIVTFTDKCYPSLLKQITDPPPILFVHGKIDALTHLQLAIVGSRNPTTGGLRNAESFSHFLAEVGLVITSGLATGIDAAAHRGALASGGITLAVLGSGPDRIYPAINQDLADSITGSGAVISEFSPGTPPLASHFPQRNRIIAGMSMGTLVVEAATRSGSLITARHALDYGREIFAIPGSIHNPLARGCHELIRRGAKLVETGRDILDELGPLSIAAEAGAEQSPPQEEPDALSSEYAQLLEFIGFDPTSVDELVRASGLTPEVVSSMLLMLELRGYLAAEPGGRYYRLM